ncbi:MAG: hypothetical protein U9N33_10105 [Campylobacterota bacterium]|nr:hypothetical protein [Campylobacterota bacterium]
MKLSKPIIFCIVLLLIISGCAKDPKPKDRGVVDNTLPLIVLTQNGTFVDMNAIAFEWKSIEDERVKGIYIYKSGNTKDTNTKLSYYKTIDNRFTTHFIDSDVKPDTIYSYSFKTFSKDAESKMSGVKTLNSLPVLQSVTWIKSIQNMPRSAKIIWRPHLNTKVDSYIIERKTLEDAKWNKIATIKGRLNAEYIDSNLKDNFVYKYRVRVVTFDDIISTPSEIVEVVTKALPLSVNNIVASDDLPKKIKLYWDKSTTEDFDRYYLYRSQSYDGSYELIAKLYNNKFEDLIEEDAKEYFYRVSAVEKNGLESIYDKSTARGSSLTKPEAPVFVKIRLINSKFEITWDNKDTRVKNYIVSRKIKTGWFDEKEKNFTGIRNRKFVDDDIDPNITYFYKVYALDENSIKSEASIEVEVKTPSTVVNSRKKAKFQKAQESSKSQEVIVPTQDFK